MGTEKKTLTIVLYGESVGEDEKGEIKDTGSEGGVSLYIEDSKSGEADGWGSEGGA